MRRLLRVVLVLLVLLAVGLGGLLWRLDRGPISLAAIQPLLQPLIDRGSPFLVSYSEPTLVWLREEGSVALAVRDIEARTRTGDFVAGAPQARIVVALAPLLERRIEPEIVELELPQIELTREPNGRLVLSFAGQLTSLPLGAGDTGTTLPALLGDRAEGGDPRLAQLRLVRVTAPTLAYVDAVTSEVVTASSPRFELRRVEDGWSGALSARFGEGRVRLTSRVLPGGTQAIAVEVDRLPLQRLTALLPQLPQVDLTMPVTGQVAFTVDPARLEPGPATIALSTSDASLGSPSFGLRAVPIEQASLTAGLEAGWRVARLDRLELRGRGYEVTATGRVERTKDSVRADLDLAASDLDVGELMMLWPETLADAGRRWVAENVPAGKLLGAELYLGGVAGRPDQRPIGGSFTFDEVELRYLKTLPPATGLKGAATFAGDSLAVTLEQGSSGGVELATGEVELSNLAGAADARLEARLDLSSSVPAAMTLLAAEPVELERVTGLSARDAAGQQTTRLELALPVAAAIPPEKISYRAETRLTGLRLTEMRPGYSLFAPNAVLNVDPARLDAQGEIEVNGVPATVTWQETLNRARSPQRQIQLEGRLDAAGAQALALEWPAPLAGSMAVEVKLVEAREPLRTIDVELDLRDTALTLAPLLITKMPGEAGTGSARIVQRSEGSANVERFHVAAGSLRAEGRADLRLSPLRPERLVLTTLSTALGDLTADLGLQGDAWRGRVDVGQLDLRPLRQGGGAGGRSPMSIPDFALELTAQSLRLGDAPLTGIVGSVERGGGIWRNAKLRGNIEGSQVTLDMETRQRTTLTMRASDAGWLIRAFAADDKGVRGGQFRLSADLQQTVRGATGAGELKIRDFTLWGAPVIARVISLASFTGLTHALSGRGVPVQRLVVPFELAQDRLTVTQARLVAADIGARAQGTVDLATGAVAIDGTVAPAYTINRILGRIPILGQILSGSGSDAALAATFSISNTLASPEVRVNPLAVLVPGMIRDLFAALTAADADNESAQPR